jgi:hypothetical protein
MVGSMPNGSRDLLWKSDQRPKTFGILLTDIDYFEDELCVSDNLEYSRGTDEESEPGSILFHTTLGRRRCQPQALLKRPADFLMEDRSARTTLSAP